MNTAAFIEALEGHKKALAIELQESVHAGQSEIDKIDAKIEILDIIIEAAEAS